MTDSTSLTHIAQISVPVENLERATAFYRDVLGFPHLFTVPNLSFLQCGTVRLMLGLPEPGQTAQKGTILYYMVADINAAYEKMKNSGVEFIDTPHLIAPMKDHDLWMTFFKDSEGNTNGLMCEIRK